jgi:hypothetical protein
MSRQKYKNTIIVSATVIIFGLVMMVIGLKVERVLAQAFGDVPPVGNGCEVDLSTGGCKESAVESPPVVPEEAPENVDENNVNEDVNTGPAEEPVGSGGIIGSEQTPPAPQEQVKSPTPPIPESKIQQPPASKQTTAPLSVKPKKFSPVSPVSAANAFKKTLGLDEATIEELYWKYHIKPSLKVFASSPFRNKKLALNAQALDARAAIEQDYNNLFAAQNAKERKQAADALLTDQTTLKRVLTTAVKVDPSDALAARALSNEYFREGDFVAARRLSAQAFVDLDAQERSTLMSRVQEETARNGFDRVFNASKPENSNFLNAMAGEINNEIGSVPDKIKDWVRKSDAYSRAEAYSQSARQIFKGLESTLFGVDDTNLDQEACGQK